MARQWTVVELVDAARIQAVEAHARRLMLKYPLRAGDALQLAGALAYFEKPRGRGFVAVDGVLANAAEAEGFTVSRPDAPQKGGRQQR